MTEEELKSFLDDNATAIKEAAKAAMIQKVQESLRWNMPGTYSEIVNEFLKDEIAPAVREALMSEKGAIIAAMTQAASEIGNTLAQAMLKQSAEAMTGYRAHEVFKAVLGLR